MMFLQLLPDSWQNAQCPEASSILDYFRDRISLMQAEQIPETQVHPYDQFILKVRRISSFNLLSIIMSGAQLLDLSLDIVKFAVLLCIKAVLAALLLIVGCLSPVVRLMLPAHRGYSLLSSVLTVNAGETVQDRRGNALDFSKLFLLQQEKEELIWLMQLFLTPIHKTGIAVDLARPFLLSLNNLFSAWDMFILIVLSPMRFECSLNLFKMVHSVSELCAQAIKFLLATSFEIWLMCTAHVSLKWLREELLNFSLYNLKSQSIRSNLVFN